MPLQDADIILERFLDYFSGMFWIVVFLELPVVAELELLCRFLQVFIQDLDAFLIFKSSWIVMRPPVPREEKHALNVMYDLIA